jgi:hypothetical protein
LDLAKAFPSKRSSIGQCAPSRFKYWEIIRSSSEWLRLTFGVGERRPGPVHDEAIFVSGSRLCRSGVPGLSAGGQSFCRYDRHRGYELRSLAIYERASLGGDRLDLRFLDRTQLRCRGQWPNSAEDQHVVDHDGSRKGMRSENIPDVGQRRVDDVSGGHEIGMPVIRASHLVRSSGISHSLRGFGVCPERPAHPEAVDEARLRRCTIPRDLWRPRNFPDFSMKNEVP